jgi:hypothetical protein
MATSKSPTCGRVKIPQATVEVNYSHPFRDPSSFLFHPDIFPLFSGFLSSLHLAPVPAPPFSFPDPSGPALCPQSRH